MPVRLCVPEYARLRIPVHDRPPLLHWQKRLLLMKGFCALHFLSGFLTSRLPLQRCVPAAYSLRGLVKMRFFLPCFLYTVHFPRQPELPLYSPKDSPYDNPFPLKWHKAAD